MGGPSKAKAANPQADSASATDKSPVDLNPSDQSAAGEIESRPRRINATEVAVGDNIVTGLPSDSDALEMDFYATAYSMAGPTASGLPLKKGIIAADPRVLPLGTVVQIKAGNYSGTYQVGDTGGRIRGRKIDIYVPNRREALCFGRRTVKLKVLGRAKSAGSRSTTSPRKAADHVTAVHPLPGN